MISRRHFVLAGSAAVGGVGLLRAGPAEAAVQPLRDWTGAERRALPPGLPGRDYTPVTTPNGSSLPFRIVRGVKVFHLVAEPVLIEMAPGLRLECWGYNGNTPGPTLEALEGEHLRFYVTNRLPEPTTVHWHGVLLPNGMDGVGGLTQPVIPPGETFVYEFIAPPAATYMYHPHWDEMVQMGMGLQGMFIVHPRRAERRVERDFAIMLSEWFVKAGARRPDPMQMTDFNVLTMNSRAFPGTEPLWAQLGERVRLRFGNLSAMSHHPIHLHGYRFWITGTDGGPIPRSAWWPETTVQVPVGTTRDIEFVADAPGDWALHCHMTHHIMNQMGHEVPNMLGIRTEGLDERIRRLIPGYMTMGARGMAEMGEHTDPAGEHAGEHAMPVPPNSIPMKGGRGPFGRIDMGGMFTILKVRRRLGGPEREEWYEHPPGTVARPASVEELRADGIDPGPEGGRSP